MMKDISQHESDLIDFVRDHVDHGHGEILIQIQPRKEGGCKLRIQEGRGHLYEFETKRR